MFLRIYKEVLPLTLLVCLFFTNSWLAFIYIIYYVSSTSLLVIAFRNKQKANTKALRFYLANRISKLLQPLIFIIIFCITGLSFVNYWYLYLLAIVDLGTVFASFDDFLANISLIKIRTPKLEDTEQLYAIEKAAFTKEQRVCKEQIKKRIQTSPGLCLVAENDQQNVVGSLYVTSVIKQQIINDKPSHIALQKGGDFSEHGGEDSLYVIGIQTAKSSHGQIAPYLMKGLIRTAIIRGYKGILAGPRLPEYHNYKDIPLDKFIHSDKAKLLKYLVKSSTIPLILKPKIVCGVKNYFPDPESLNCAALAYIPTTFLFLPNFLRTPAANILYLLAICF